MRRAWENSQDDKIHAAYNSASTSAGEQVESGDALNNENIETIQARPSDAAYNEDR